MPRYNNVFLSDTSTTYKFTLTPKMGTVHLPQIENRQAHSDKLISQYREAQEQFNRYTPQQVAAITYSTGTYIEFSGASNCDLITKSLEDQRQGIRLLNVRDVVNQVEDGKIQVTTHATVFIPKGKEDVFIKKLHDYTELTPKGKPKNNDLVSSIDSITNALKISAFWIGRSSDLPDETQKWYELWLDAPNNVNDVIEKSFAVFDSLGLTHRTPDEIICFPERIVVPIYANCTQLLDLIKLGVKVAEIRKPADPNVFFLDSPLTEQSGWANDLISRTVFSNPTVAVCILDTGVNKNHILIDPYMPTNAMTAESQWGVADNNGHGTNMAGIALYNDLKEQLISNQSIQVNHLIESVKVYEPNSPTSPNLYGVITQTATLLPEIAAPDTKRIYCMAVTDPTSASNDGQPSSWSGAIDNLAFENNKRLYILSAGNTDITDLQNDGYPDACLNKSVEDPAQSWNALTVGAYTIDTEILPNAQTRGYTPVAQQGELSPYSSTCETWKKQWPIKPEVVCDGGNVATDGTNYLDGLDELSKLTLNKDISKRLFDTIWATSAATAQCSYIAAELMATYPDMHPETLRALIVHSARWTNAMKNQFGYPDTKTQGRKKLLRTCGYGVPDLARARDTLNNCVNMIIEDELQPYEKNSTGSPKMNEMHLHEIPWPQEILSSLENAEVKVRITLSYFVEPGPGQKGWKYKYRYASCGLRFDMKRPNETTEGFRQRINKAMREEDYQNTTGNDNWYLGPTNRDVGSIHSDVWNDTAINLSHSNLIAVYPVIGWWRERANLKRYNSKIRYSLIVTIETPNEQVDLYTPIMTQVANKVLVAIENNNDLE